jgi:CubicO group peptidase (beta-lactamase class C family)
MRVFGKWLGRVLLTLVVAVAVIGLWKREEITRLMAVNSLFNEDKIVANFSSMDGAFLTVPVSRGSLATSALPYGPETDLPPEVETWIKDRAVTSLLVMKDGEIVFENYYRGTGADDRRISWSIAKSYLSALFGVLIAEGTITSLDDPVTKYAPLLKGGAYDGATIRNVLQMSSGVTFDEDYLDYYSDIKRMGRVLALGGLMDEFAAGLTDTFQAPGAGWKYVSIDTHIIGMIVRGATGRGIANLLSEKIIAPLGQEHDAYYVTDGAGVAFVLGGLNLTTRDYARFGLMIAQNGRYGDVQVVPAEWVAASTVASAPTEPGKIGYGYQWWIPVGAGPGEFTGRGIYGQYLYIDQTKGVVIVTTAADLRFRNPGIDAANYDVFRRLADHVQK